MRVEVTDDDGRYVDVNLASDPRSGSWTTLLTGRNGAGKSRLLSAIAASFESLDGRHLRQKNIVAISYLLAGRECAFRVEKGTVSAFLDGSPVDRELLPRPGAVVAATASAFDKFGLPKEPLVFGGASSPTGSGLYKYLGLKDSRGRVSSRAGVFRALEQLFDANSDHRPRRRRVADVFNYLGYKPAVEVIYAWTMRARDLIENDGGVTPQDVANFLHKQREQGRQGVRRSIPNYMFGDEQVATDLAMAIERLKRSADGRELKLVADFSNPNPGEEDHLRMARQLTRAGLVQMSEVSLRRANTGQKIDIADASSGELSLVVTLLGIASSIEDNSLILIDEPEISLHPQWQTEYLERLGDAFADFRNCHFVVATHSPTLVSGADSERTSIVALEVEGSSEHRPEVAGSVDEVLVTTFGVVSKGNLFLRDLLVTALRAAEDGELANAVHDDTMAALERARMDLSEADDVVQLINQLVRIRAGLAEREKQ